MTAKRPEAAGQAFRAIISAVDPLQPLVTDVVTAIYASRNAYATIGAVTNGLAISCLFRALR